MRYLVIGDKDTVLAFSLVGVKGIVANSKKEAMQAINQAITCKEVGIVLITEKLARKIQQTIDELLCRKRYHLILQIPDTNGSMLGRPSVEEFVGSALGVQV